MSATIKEVARRAGVSVATVSRALNASAPVRERTRRRVLEVARELNYTPNSAARTLITRRTGMFGVLLPEVYGEFFSELIRGCDEAAQAGSYHLLLSSSHDHPSEIAAALQGMHGRVDGLVVMAPTASGQILEATLPPNVPTVLLNSPGSLGPFHSVRMDNFGGARAMASHLLAHGHERLAIITGPAGNHDSWERLGGYRAALQDAGVAWSPDLEIPGDFTGAAGYRGAELMLRLEPRPTALFAANDAMAIGALSALQDAGVRVPEEIALAGFDDVSSTRYMSPPLSSVHVAISELGARAITMLLEAVASPEEGDPRHELLEATPVIRRSCGCAGADTQNSI